MNAPGLGDVCDVTPSMAMRLAPTFNQACVAWHFDSAMVSCAGMFVLSHVPSYSRSRAKTSAGLRLSSWLPQIT